MALLKESKKIPWPRNYAPRLTAAIQTYDLTASREMLFTPNFLLAPLAFSEMN